MDQKQVQVKIGDSEMKGVYANVMNVASSPEEFCLDFLNMFPPATLTARVITSPGHLKRMIDALKSALDKYEQQHGEVVAAEEPEKPNIGF